MTSRYKAYPEYRDSRVKWLGKLPSDWEVTRLKFITSIYGRIGFRGYTTADIVNEGEGALVLSPSNVYDGKLELSSKAFLSWEKYYESPEIIVEPNDILLVKTGSTYGKSAIVDDNSEPMTINPQMALLKNSKVPPKYLAYVMSSSLIKSIIEVSNTGSGMPTMTQENINSFPIPMPSNCWAEKIANFLDHETAKIDTLIAKQEKLIELLKEKRQAVISHAVTKGLNPNAPMRDSGVEWLGEVPEYWELKKFKYLFKIRKRIAGKTGLDILSITKKGIKVKDISSGEGQLSMDYSKYQLVNAGDFAMNHMDLLTGFVDISKYNGVTSPDYRVFTLEHKYSDSDYYLRVLQMGYLDKVFYPLGQGAANIGRWRLPTEAFNEFLAPCPPYKEQEQISSFINKTHDKIDALLEKAESAINLMKERKTALISAAVIGKIDVRDFVSEQGQPQGV